MIEVQDGIFIGCDADVDEFYADHENGYCIHAAKEPYHRKAVGYTGRGAPKDHPEYLMAHRDTFTAYNLVDSPKPEFIPRAIFDSAFELIAHLQSEGKTILINCNQGKSRSVGIYLFYFCQANDLPLVAGIEYLEEVVGMEVELGDGVLGALTEWLD